MDPTIGIDLPRTSCPWLPVSSALPPSLWSRHVRDQACQILEWPPHVFLQRIVISRDSPPQCKTHYQSCPFQAQNRVEIPGTSLPLCHGSVLIQPWMNRKKHWVNHYKIFFLSKRKFRSNNLWFSVALWRKVLTVLSIPRCTPYFVSIFCYLLTYPSPNQQQSMCCSVTLISRRITGIPGSHLYPRASFLIIVPPLQHPSNKEDNNDHCVLQFFIQRVAHFGFIMSPSLCWICHYLTTFFLEWKPQVSVQCKV